MSFVKLAPLRDIQEGKLLSVNTIHGRVALTRRGEDIFAFEDRCSHDDGLLSDGALINGAVECCRHGAQFDIKTGKCLRMPATEDIEVYKTRQVDGWLEADLELD